MANNKVAFATSTPFAITLDSLAVAAGRSSAFVDNETSLYVDAHVSVKFTLAATVSPAYGQAEHQCVYVYAYGSEDGVTYGAYGGGSTGTRELIDGTDKAITTGGSASALWACRLCAIAVHPGASNVVYVSPPLGVAHAFGGVLPRQWGIVVVNRANIAFASSGCSASYTGISATTL
jgi:hypothetical protein